MLNRVLISAAFAAGLCAMSIDPAAAVIPEFPVAAVEASSPLLQQVRVRKRFGIRGTVRPAQKLNLPGVAIQPNSYPKYLYNDPQYFDPSQPPLYDGLRQDYPGYGLFR